MIHQLSNLWAIVATILLAGCLALDLRKGPYRILSGRNVVLVTVFVWYLLEALRIPMDLTRYTAEEYEFGIFIIAISVGVFLAAYHTCAVPLFAPLARRLPV